MKNSSAVVTVSYVVMTMSLMPNQTSRGAPVTPRCSMRLPRKTSFRRPRCPKLGRNQTEPGGVRPSFGRIWNRSRSKFGIHRSGVGRLRDKLGLSARPLAKFGRMLDDSGANSVKPRVARTLPKNWLKSVGVGRYLADSGPNLGDVCPSVPCIPQCAWCNRRVCVCVRVWQYRRQKGHNWLELLKQPGLTEQKRTRKHPQNSNNCSTNNKHNKYSQPHNKSNEGAKNMRRPDRCHATPPAHTRAEPPGQKQSKRYAPRSPPS